MQIDDGDEEEDIGGNIEQTSSPTEAVEVFFQKFRKHIQVINDVDVVHILIFADCSRRSRHTCCKLRPN